MKGKAHILAAAGIAAAVLFIYAKAFSSYFYEDDFQWLVSRWTFHPTDLLNLRARYKPVFELYFWIAGPLFGGSPAVYHAASIAIHIVNGWLILAIASRLGMQRGYAFAAALLFVVQPAYVAAVAWVGALAEALVVLFGCASLLAVLKFRDTRAWAWNAAAVASFTVALFAHESAVVFLPIIVFADFIVNRRDWRSDDLVRIFWPFITVITIYLSLTFSANTADYRADTMQYRFGLHMIRNTFEYIASLYVGERKIVWHVVVTLVLGTVLVFGTPRARLGIAWMVLGILPFAPFEMANVSRYAYIPAIGLAILLAEGLAALAAVLARRSAVAAHAVAIVLVAFMALRFSHFARDGVKDLDTAAERYRTFLAELRREHPQLPDHAVVYMTPEREKVMAQRFVEAAVQWEYRNNTLRVQVR